MEPQSRHQCMIYGGSPSRKLPVLAAIIKHKLGRGYRCLYLNSIPMVAGMKSTLASLGVDVAGECEKARLILSSEQVVQADAPFDSAKMIAKLERALDQALNDGYKGLWASGDMTWEFGPERDFSKLLEYELLLEDLFARRSEICGICQYHSDTLPAEALRHGMLTHSGIAVSETLRLINPHYQSKPTPGTSTQEQLDSMIRMLCAL